MEQKRMQHIYCTVGACRHHGQENQCMLSGIEVSQAAPEARIPEDSMCRSFEKRKG